MKLSARMARLSERSRVAVARVFMALSRARRAVSIASRITKSPRLMRASTSTAVIAALPIPATYIAANRVDYPGITSNDPWGKSLTRHAWGGVTGCRPAGAS